MMRTSTLLLILLISLPGFSQKKGKPAPFNSMNKSANNKFLEKQFWLGFKAGANLTNPVLQTSYTVITPVNYSDDVTEKQYDSFNKLGLNATLELTFAWRSLGISFQPTYRTSRFTNTHELEWTNPENSTEHLIMKFDQEQRLDFADFPLLLKYEILGNKLRPYVQAGVVYSLLINAVKTVEVSGTDYASGGVSTLKSQPVIVGAKDLFDNNWSILAGAGVNYNLGNVRVVLDASYRIGMSNVANVSNRFGNDRLSGIGDVQDDLRLQNIVLSIGCLFPLRFLSNDFRSLD